MRRGTLFLALGLCGVLALEAGATPIKRRHKPWGRASKTTPAPANTKPAVQVKSVPAATQSPARISRNEKTSASRRKMKPVAGSEVTGKGQQIAKQALSYEGTRYRFGGTSKRGIDCSGLVARVYQDLQMNQVPRMSASLYQKGTPVKLGELQPGDLVFFKNTYKRGISHVGVYAGKNQFIHASSRRGVTVTYLSDPYFQLRYAGARRLY